jgi:RHS repeat-associated protein
MRWSSRPLTFVAALVLTVAGGCSRTPLGDLTSPAQTAPRGFVAAVTVASIAVASATTERAKENLASVAEFASRLTLGEQYDPNLAFYYLRARYYAPGQGRFTTMDAWAGNTSVPASLHRYSYASTDPVNNSDPTGWYTQQDGYDVEAVVEEYYREDHRGDRVLFGQPYDVFKPDILNLTGLIYNEIKPATVTGATSALAQMGVYWREFGPSSGRVPPFFPDVHWKPRDNPIVVRGRPFYIENVMGVLFYSDDRALAYELSFASDLETARRKIRYGTRNVTIAPGTTSAHWDHTAVALFNVGIAAGAGYTAARLTMVMMPSLVSRFM